MDLGVRQIRTAGKGSGSIELTLPADLRDLVGLPCRIVLRDGSRPDIVLQPDLRRAHQAFTSIWDAMAAALPHGAAAVDAHAGEAVEAPLAAFGFGLQPRGGGGDVPYLCWRDGLALAGPPPHDATAVSRTIAACAQALGASLHIAAALAIGFGEACGFLVAGVPATLDGQEACDLAAAALRPLQPGGPLQAAGAEGAMGAAFWQAARPVLAAVAGQFRIWSADPAVHAALRAAWRRGRALAMDDGWR